MTTPRDPDRLIHAFVREGAEQLDDQVYDAVRAEIEQKRQRVVIGPWRVPNREQALADRSRRRRRDRRSLPWLPIHRLADLECGRTGEPAAGDGGSLRGAGIGGPVGGAVRSPPPLTQTYTSMHGISVSYPEGWTARAATEPWTGAGDAALRRSRCRLTGPGQATPVPGHRLAADRQVHARGVGRGADRARVGSGPTPIGRATTCTVDRCQ